MAAIGGGQAVLGHAAKNQAASARNKNRAELYRQQQAKLVEDHYKDVAGYYIKGVDAEEQFAENALAASLGAEAEQIRLNQGIAEALKASEDDYVKAISDSRSAASLERSGKSAGRVSSARKALLGSASAARAAQLDTARDAASIAFKQVARQRDAANKRAYAAIGLAPERGREPLKPVWDRGPGMASLAAGVIGGAVSGYIQGDQLGNDNILRNR